MNTKVDQRLASGGVRRRAQGAVGALLCGVLAEVPLGAVRADNLANVYYDARTDELVVTMSYRGTNPDHQFSLKWGQCRDSTDVSGHEIDVVVLDSQWQDAALQDFKKTTSFSLADLGCRPAKLILRTPPRSYYVLQIPLQTGR